MKPFQLGWFNHQNYIPPGFDGLLRPFSQGQGGSVRGWYTGRAWKPRVFRESTEMKRGDVGLSKDRLNDIK